MKGQRGFFTRDGSLGKVLLASHALHAEGRIGVGLDVAVGQAHRIANQGDETLVIIEVQRGAYTGEDDIVRLDVDYGRSS